MKQIELKLGERILAVVPQKCSGPGWSNFVAWVYIGNSCGEVRTDCLQQEDWSDDLFALAGVGEAMSDALIQHRREF